MIKRILAWTTIFFLFISLALGFELWLADHEREMWRDAYGYAAQGHDVANQLLHEQARLISFSSEYDISVNLVRDILDAAEAYDIPPEIAFRLVETESEFKPHAVSPKQAVGLTQVLPSTAQALSPSVSRADLFDPRKNLALGFQYLRLLHNRFGVWETALIAYHRGPTRTSRELRRGGNHGSSHQYARRILR